MPIERRILYTSILIRGLSLGSRFVLTLFMGNFLGLAEIGEFGLIVAITIGGPAVLGLGLNYFINRTVSSLDRRSAIKKIRDRLLLSFLAAFFSVLIYFGFLFAFDSKSDLLSPILGAVVIMEIVALDLHYGIVALGQIKFANFLLFIRSAAWVYVYVAIAYIYPEFRNIDSILWFWFISLIFLYLVVLFVLYAKNIFRGLDILGGIDAKSVLRIIPGALWVYMSDIAIFLISFFDRFFLSKHVSQSDLGAYVFCQTLASSAYILTSAGIVQGLAKRLISSKNNAEQLKIVNKAQTESILVISFLALSIYLFFEVIQYFGFKIDLSGYRWLMLLLIFSNYPRIISDIYSQLLYSRGLDRWWIRANYLGVVLIIIAFPVLFYFCGLGGAAFSLLLVNVLVALYKRKTAGY